MKMDILKIREEKMVAVKRSLLILVSIFFVISCASSLSLQQVLHGTFYVDYNNSSGESSFSYQFKDGTFIATLSQNLDMGAKSKGSYQLASDTLILEYEPYDKPESSTYRFISKTPVTSQEATEMDTLGSVSFRIVNREGNPIRSANVVARNNAEKMISGYGADSLGRGPKQFITERVDEFYIGFVGRHSVTIPADTLAGYNSEVEVMLTGTTYNHYDGIKKFLIEEVDKNRIVMQRLEDNERMVLIREGSGD